MENVVDRRDGRGVGGGATAGLLAAPRVRQLEIRRQPGRQVFAPLQAAAQSGAGLRSDERRTGSRVSRSIFNRETLSVCIDVTVSISRSCLFFVLLFSLSRSLRLFRHFDPFRILICSGDGSIGWVLSEIDKLHMDVSGFVIACESRR